MSEINSQPDNQAAWDNQMAIVNKIVDSLNYPIDPGIKETVCALMMHDFPTIASCEGHLPNAGKDVHGLPYPWIDISTKEPDGFDDAKGIDLDKLGEKWYLSNLSKQRRMMLLLDEFYKNRKIDYPIMLAFEPIGAWGSFRLRSSGGEQYQIQTPEEVQEFYVKYRNEMADFTEFLKKKIFLSEKETNM